MISVLGAILEKHLTAIKTVPEVLEMMDSFAEMLNMEQVVAILGILEILWMTVVCSKDVSMIMEGEDAKRMDL